MAPTRRQLLAALLGLVVAAGCIKLGLWQLDRLRQRRLQNDIVVARLYALPAPPYGLIPGTRQWRRIVVTGTFDFDHQIVFVGRSSDGSPGVDILTPFTPDGRGKAILVDRGWVYSADAQTVDLKKFDEGPHTTVHGYVEEFEYRGVGPARTASTPNAWRRLDAWELEKAFPYPIAQFYLVAQPDSGATPRADAPLRHPLPTIDEGPHRGYAIQWFAFAVIALVGASVVIYQEQKTRPGGNP